MEKKARETEIHTIEDVLKKRKLTRVENGKKENKREREKEKMRERQERKREETKESERKGN